MEIVYGVVCLAMLIVMLFMIGYSIHAFWISGRLAVAAERTKWPKAVLIIPCKGNEPGLEENLRRHFQHDYPDYQILFTLAAAHDPAMEIIHRLIAQEGRPASVVIAPRLPDCVEKVSNQIAAFQAIPADVEVIVCVDSDGLPRDRNWLLSLVASLERCALVSGFRWYVPAPSSFVGHLQSAWDSNWFLLHALGKTVWGGAMAFTRETYVALRFEEHLRCAITDDLTLQVCTHRAGKTTGFTPGGMMISRPAHRFGDFFRWAVRQSQIVRLVTPAIWLMGFWAANVFACFSVLSPVMFFVSDLTWGWHGPAAALGLVALYYAGRGYMDYRLARLYFSDHAALAGSLRWVYYWANPLADLLAPVVAYASLLSSTITWRGVRYRIKKGRVVRLSGQITNSTDTPAT